MIRTAFRTAAIVAVLGLAPAISAQSLDEARALQTAGRLEAAVDAYRSIAARAVDDPATAGIAWNNACVALIDLGDFPAALSACEHAVALRRTLGDRPRLGRSYNNLGLALQHLGRFDEAAEAMEGALEISRAQQDAVGQAINLTNLGVVATSGGRYGLAMRRLAEAEALIQTHASESWAAGQQALVVLNQGVVLERLGAFDEALDRYEALVASGAELSPRQRAGLAVNMGTLFRNLGDPVRAVERYREAIAVWNDLEDRAALANATLNLALALHLNLGRHAEAEVAYREALSLATAAGDRPERLAIEIHLGDLLLEAGRFAEARQHYERCLQDASDPGAMRARWSALDGLGRVARAEGRLEAAAGHWRRALMVIEDIRAAVDDADLRATYFRSRRSVYGNAVAVLAALDREQPGMGHARAAFEVVLRAKDRELIEVLGGAVGLTRAGDSVAVQRALGDATLIELFLAGDRLLRLTVTGDDLILEDRGAAAPTLAVAGQVHQALATGTAPRPTHVLDLSERLLGGLDFQGIERLFVAPDGRLRYLPFEILRPPESVASLLDLATVAYLPSGAALRRTSDERSSRQAPERRFIGFGDPTPPDSIRPASPAGLLAARFSLERLPGAADELHHIARQFGGDQEVQIDGGATETAFRRSVGQGAHVVHLATHALVDERLGNRAAVMLAADDSHDGWLLADEIAGLDYRADLTVLAACSTAIGGPDDGRGLSSLTGAFLAAGSQAVVATLWDVGDRTTEAFMQQLYHHLARGARPAEAMRQAKIRLRDDPRWRGLDRWSAYILVGEAPPVRRRWAGGGIIVVGLGLLLALVAWRFHSGTARLTARPSR